MRSAVFIDLSSIFRAAWHASEHQEISTASQKTVEAVHSHRTRGDLCAVCLDAPPYRRRKLSDGYKAHRDTPPPQLREQERRIVERLEADGFLLWSAPGYEADDIIATAVRQAVDDESIGAIVVVSSDKDLLCLVDDAAGVSQYSPATQKLLLEEDVREKFGVPPALVPDLLALMGDKSDGIVGVPGIGQKIGAQLLHDFGALPQLIANAAKVPNSVGQKLRDNVEAAKLARELVRLETDAPIDFDQLFAEREARPLSQVQDAEFEDPAVDADTIQNEGLSHVRAETGRFDSGTPRQPSPDAEILRPQPVPTPALALRPPEWSLALEPTSTRDAYTMATHLFNSRLFSAFGNPEGVFAVILRGRSLGLDAATALSTFHVIEGKPTMHASLIIGLILRSGKAKFFELLESTNECATWETHRIGNRKPMRMSFDVDDALAAGLMERRGSELRGVSKSGRPSNWDKYRRTMLRWRAAVELARAVYPDVVTGLYTPDEVSDGRVSGED